MLLAASAPAQSLVSARWLRQHLAQVHVLAVAPAAAYQYGHIPGAIPVSPAHIPQLTLTPAQRLVLYQYSGWPIAAARVFAQLDALGLGRRAAILNGGWHAWLAAHGAVQAGSPPRPSPSSPSSRQPRPVFVDRAYIAAHLNDPDVLLLDARLPVYFNGLAAELPGEPLGHIPGAINVPFTALATRNGYFRPRPQLAAAFRHLAIPGKTLIVYCHSGRKAAIDYFAARLLGFRVRFYRGSWLDWTRR